MKPAQIHVFDGLRITTEHVEHMQGAMRSAVADVRQLLGLGRAHVGLEVEKSGPMTVTIRPGLAFDWERNRIVCDEPETLDISFPDAETEQVVCIRHVQVVGNEIEGQATLIWDSCAPLLRTGMPGRDDNVVPLARVVQQRSNGETTFEVAPLHEPEGETSESRAQETSSPLNVAQGIAHIPSSPESGSLEALLVEPLRRQMANGGAAPLRIRLAETYLTFLFAPLSLSCETRVDVSGGTDGPTWQAGARGEATLADTITQWSSTTVYPNDDGRAPRLHVGGEGLAMVPLPGGSAVFSHLSLLLQVEHPAPTELRLVQWLVWEGVVDETMIAQIEGQLTTETVVAWKVIGAER